MRRIAALALLVAACGGGTEGIAVVANTQQALTPGPNRILMAIASETDGTFLSDQDRPTVARFSKDGSEVAVVDTEWVWAIPGVRGFLVANVDLPEAGRWDLVLDPADGPPTLSTPFGVQPSSPVPAVGDPAISAASRTHPDFPLEALSSDSDPDPDLYRLSLDEAIADGRPTLVAFATPAFCQTATCGPTLDVVRGVMGDYPGIDFVHVEVFELDGAAAGRLEPVPAVVEWGLPSEPWVFVIDSDGVVVARFEGALGPEELRRSLDSVG